MLQEGLFGKIFARQSSLDGAAQPMAREGLWRGLGEI